MTWLITDTHFNHKNIIEYCNRPDDYEQQIIDNWQQLVKPTDTIYHLGDVVMGSKATMREFYENVFSRLPGKKILVRGNHDHRLNIGILEHYWEEVAPSMTLVVGGYSLWLQHEPLTATKLERLTVEGQKIDYCVHGHLHNTQKDRAAVENKNILFALEYDGYKPQPLEQWLEKKLQKRKDTLFFG